MTQVNLYEAKTQLSKLVDRAAKGEDIVIAKNGEPIAMLMAPAKVSKPKREFGFLKGEMDEALSDKAWKESDEEVRKLFDKSVREEL